MAIAFRSSSSADLTGPGGTTTITLPGGVHATDVVIAIFGSTRNSTTNPNVVTAPAGWTSIATSLSANDGTNELSLYGFWALGNVANLGFTNSQTSGLKQGWACAAFTGVDNSTPIDATAAANSGSASDVTNAVTVATANAWHVIGGCDLNSHEITSTGFTAANNGAPPVNASAIVLYNTTPKSAGSTGTQNIGISVSDPGDIVAGMPFALRPSAPTPNISAGLISASLFRAKVVNPNLSAALVSASVFRGLIARPQNISASLVSASRLTGTLIDGTPPTAGGNPNVEWEIRLYDVNGKRIRLPRGWVETVDFELGENGGYLNGTVTVLAPWETLQLLGNERVDVWLWGILVYRGYVRLPQDEEAMPERHTFTLHGLMQTLQGYLVRRNFAYAVETDIGTLFRDLVNFYVKQPGRLPNLQVDTSGVAALNLTVQTFDATGRDFAQAMNDLVALSPGSLIWGCDVDISSRDRIYLRPRSAAVKYKYAVGEKVTAFVYPRDTTQIVNALYVTGGKMTFPNLAPNASFEKVVAPGETTANLLLDASFEDASGGTVPNWLVVGNPTSYASAARTGSISLKMDNNPTTEVIGQEVYLPALPVPVNWSVYARCPVGQAWHINTHLDLYDIGGSVITGTGWGPFLVPPDGNWHRYSGSWTVPVTAGAVKVRLVLFPSATDSGGGGVDDGLELDDAALWFGTVLSESWQPGRSSNATFTGLDWQNRDIVAYDGDVSIKVTPNIISGGGYAELQTTAAARISVKTNNTYVFSLYVAGDVVSPPEIALAARGYTGGVEGHGLITSSHYTINSGLWRQITYTFNTGAADAIDLLILFYNSNPAWIDAAGLWASNAPNPWYPEQNYVAHRTVLDYAGMISTEAAASITNYNLREKEMDNPSVIDQSSLDALAVGYFNAHAVPVVQARLELFGPTAPLLLNGSVQILNLPSEPPALFPSRVRYALSTEAIRISGELGNQRPDLALLLQKAAKQALI